MIVTKQTCVENPRTYEVTSRPLRSGRVSRIVAALALGSAAIAILCAVPSSVSASVPIAGHCPADVDGDGLVGGRDVALLAQSWLAVPGDLRWDAGLDLNGDLIIGAEDYSIIFSYWLARGCDAAAVATPTLWTGTEEFHESFCPGGEVFFEAYDPQSPEGPPLYRTPLMPEECLRSPVPGPAVYGCEVEGEVVNALTVEVLPGENVTEEGYHVCNQEPPSEELALPSQR